MLDQTFDCLADSSEGAWPLYAIRPDGLAGFLDTLPAPQAAFLTGQGFAAKAQELIVLPGPEGIAGAVLGLGSDRSPFAFGGLATRLPAASAWQIQPGDFAMDQATLGFCLGAYRYTAFKAHERAPARLVLTGDQHAALSQAAAMGMVRDLINTPSNALGPVELGDFAAALGARHGAAVTIVEGADLERLYPTVAAVARGSARPGRVVTLRWRGSQATETSPLLSLCGKGVCFDSGGYDLKPSAGMLRMKKDMGGAAHVLGLMRMIMDADLPLRVTTRIGCVENAVSGSAMRPLDIVRTRSGLTVEIGNTDAEGRLVLCDLLSEASDESPALLLDCATLTGAARVAVGPDLVPVFCNDDAWSDNLLQFATMMHEPMWRLPLWEGYAAWLKSPIADLNNVSSQPQAGAITAALFLKHFVTTTIPWIHLDLYAWNDQARPGRPAGGESQGLRAIFATVKARLCASQG